MHPLLSKISTNVRKVWLLSKLRLSFRVGSWLQPSATLERAGDLFCTPFASARIRALRAPTAGADEKSLDVDGMQIATYTWGDPRSEPYVLFAHGWSSHGTRIVSWIEPLRAVGYAVVAFDQAGHGRSDGKHTTLIDFACNLIAVQRHFGPASVVFGHSLGATAVAVALANGLNAKRAVLVAPAADLLAAIERFARIVGLPSHLARRVFARFERRMCFNVAEHQAQHVAPYIARPALIVHDLEDREVPWEEGERYARYWPRSRLVSTRGLGHNRIVDHPSTMDAVLHFIDGGDVGESVVSSPNLPYGFA